MTLNLVRRSTKGSPLTAADHDGNLDKLEDAIEGIELTPGPQGPAGADGVGAAWQQGAGVPAAGVGEDGDFYLNVSNGDIYGPKTAGAWSSVIFNIAEGQQGPAGATGPAGPEGPQGPAGAQGAPGEQGPAGVAGADGAPGADGADAYEVAVAEGFSGTRSQWLASLVGPAGPQGETGPAGADGADGATGPQGPAGAQGAGLALQGSVPTVGDLPGSSTVGYGYIVQATGDLYVWNGSSWVNAGPIQGPQGPAGATGPQGPAGPTGADGAQGPAGPEGPQGATGPAGSTGAQGPQGEQGPAGPAGADGADGATGAPGADGIDGRTILSGSGAPSSGTGSDGDFFIDTAADAIYGPKTAGAWGSPTSLIGPQGPAGADGADGADGATGPQGPAGPQGETGPQGATGPQGPAGSDATATPLSDATPQALGTAAAGTASSASRSDHVHPLPATVSTSAAGLQPASGYGTISYAAQVTLDFAALAGQMNSISLTGALELLSSNLANGREVRLRLVCDATQRTLTFPTDWKFVGTKPANLAASKVAVLSLAAFGATNADVVAAYAVQS